MLLPPWACGSADEFVRLQRCGALTPARFCVMPKLPLDAPPPLCDERSDMSQHR